MMEKITLVYDLIRNDFPIMNGFSDVPSALFLDIEQLTKTINLSAMSIDKIDNLSDHTLYIYPIELLRIDWQELFMKFNNEVLTKIKHFRIPILIYLPTEGLDEDATVSMLDKIHYFFEKFGLQKNFRFLIFGNLLIKNSYDNYLMSEINELNTAFKNERKLYDKSILNFLDINLSQKISSVKFHKVYGINYFETRYKEIMIHRWKNNFFQNKEEISLHEMSKSKKEKNFLSYNGNFRPGRLALVSELVRNNWDSESYVSFLGGPGGPYSKLENCVSAAEKMLNYEGRIFFSKYIENWKPKFIDINCNGKQQDICQSKKRHYLDTYFSLVSETEIDKNSLFLTEKIFKPIVFHHPFIVWGSPGSLRHMRSLGYETFPEMFSEEYDDVDNEELRLRLIIDQIDTFVKLDKTEKDAKFASVLKKLEHNRNLFFSNHNRFDKDMKDIFLNIRENIDGNGFNN